MANTFSNYSSSAPADYGLDLAITKKYLRVDHNLDDDLINMLITGSLDATEDFLGYPITSRSMSGDYPTDWTVSIAPFYVKDAAVMVGTSSFTDYTLVNKPNGAYLYLGSLPSTDSIHVDFTTGDATVSSNIRLAMLKYVVDSYEQRSNDVYGASVAKPSFSFVNLLHPNKRYTLS